jgi:predicted nucleic acid-binding protein
VKRGFLVDTNVVSELRKGPRTNARVRSWYDSVDAPALWMSVLSLGEIRRGVENVRRRDPAGATALDRWLQRLSRDHRGRVLPVTSAISDAWGALDARTGPLPIVDGLLAATAIVHELILVTRNVADFTRTGIDVFDPWG